MNPIHDMKPATGEVQRRPNRIVLFFINFFLPLVALACGIALTAYLLRTSPEAKPKKRPPAAVLVEVAQISPGPQQTSLNGMGEIIPAREIDLSPRVTGEILETSPSFIPGGFFEAGDRLVSIDRADYELSISQLESQYRQAESDLLVEMGNQRIASKEFALLGESVSQEEQELILRKPQLMKLEAARELALAKLNQAKLDLERTAIKAPFNGVILAQGADIGARVSQSTVLATLVGTDAFWLRLTLPVEQLAWVELPDSEGNPGSEVKVYNQGSGTGGAYRTGRVIRLDAALEEQGRMARLLVEIDDPLCLKEENKDKPKLLLGSYVSAEIKGKTVSSGIRLERSYLHDGNKVWLMDEDGTLEIRPVHIIFRDLDHVIINGDIQEGEKVITSSLTAPIEGTPLRLVSGQGPGQESKGNGQMTGMGKGGGKREQQ